MFLIVPSASSMPFVWFICLPLPHPVSARWPSAVLPSLVPQCHHSMPAPLLRYITWSPKIDRQSSITIKHQLKKNKISGFVLLRCCMWKHMWAVKNFSLFVSKACTLQASSAVLGYNIQANHLPTKLRSCMLILMIFDNDFWASLSKPTLVKWRFPRSLYLWMSRTSFRKCPAF